MGDHSSSTSPFSPPNHDSNSRDNLPMLYYGLVVIGTAAIIVTIYNLIIIRWCSQERPRRPPRGGLVGLRLSQLQARGYDLAGLSSFKYKKKGGSALSDVEQGGGELECPVCLSDFEEDQEVRQLPRCHHSFHAPCIDMWFYSHSDCPLCRTPVSIRSSFHLERTAADAVLENSREGLLGSGVLVSEAPHM